MPHKTKFIDQARIFVQAGDGGDGHVSFRREAFIPRGGPDGGDGGRGGDIALIGSGHRGSLQDFQYRRHFRAEHGKDGGNTQKTGRDGKSIELRVPVGTLVLDAETGNLLGELLADGDRFVIGEGGRGGLGNIHFKSSTNRTPRRFTPGEKREGRWIRLELRLLADVGIVGPPNAGKSTLLGALTAARPKVAAYPFTTLTPSLGVLWTGEKRLVLADLPGLLEGAHGGVGLGIQFLRHISRTRALLFLVAADVGDPAEVFRSYGTTREEIGRYDARLKELPGIIVLNKTDLKSAGDVKQYVAFFRKRKVRLIPISAQKKTGLAVLLSELAGLFDVRPRADRA